MRSLTSLYWWHPAVWLARRELRQAEEECCDALVVETLSGSPQAYATGLVETVDFLSVARPVPPLLACGLGEFKALKRRIAMIVEGYAPCRLSWIARLALVTLAVLWLPLRLAQPEESVEKDKATAPVPTPAPGSESAEIVQKRNERIFC